MIPHNKPTLGSREILATERVINRGWVAQGQEVSAFEDDISNFLGIDQGCTVLVSSGTSALFLALWALKSKGSRVGVPVYSCSALRNAISMVGATPVYLDCAKGSPNLDLESARLSNIDVLIAPSMFGVPIEIDNTRKYKVIEDIAQSFGAKDGGLPIGLRGEIGICSFYATKLITTGGQGGVIFSNDKNLIDSIKDYREFDNRRDERIRFNFQMTDIQAAIGREQLKQFNKFKERREEIFSLYKDAGLSMIDCDNDLSLPVRYRAVLKTTKPKQMIDHMKKKGITAIVPIEKSELLSNPDNYRNANVLSESTVSLPIYPNLEHHDVDKIKKCVMQFI